MIAVNQGDLLWMRDMQEETMIDECMILTWSTTGKGRYNSSKGEFEDGETFPCGFKPGATREVSDGTQMVAAEGIMRLPLAAGVELNKRNRIKLIKRQGAAITAPPIYEIIGKPLIGPTGIQINLRLAVDA